MVTGLIKSSWLYNLALIILIISIILRLIILIIVIIIILIRINFYGFLFEEIAYGNTHAMNSETEFAGVVSSRPDNDKYFRT